MSKYQSEDEAGRFDPYPDVDMPSGMHRTTSTDIVHQHTRERITRENETFLQQQKRLKREHRKDVLFVVVGCILFAAYFTWQAWRSGR